MSYGLVQAGLQNKNEANKGLADVAKMEEQRGMHNDQIKAADRQSKTSGAMSGATMGAMVGGPWGALIGGAFGYVLS